MRHRGSKLAVSFFLRQNSNKQCGGNKTAGIYQVLKGTVMERYGFTKPF